MKLKHLFLILIIFSMLSNSCSTGKEQPISSIQQILDTAQGQFAVAYKNLTTGETVFFNEDSVFHAASTMKTPIMVELYRNVSDGKFTMNDSVLIKNEFTSIVDGSIYQLDSTADSEKSLYQRVGTSTTLYELTKEMIITSSNLATNILIEWVKPEAIKQTLAAAGIEDVKVLRGVEDGKAYRAGLNNTTTARGMMLFFEALYENKFTTEAYTKEMIDILGEQKFNEIIPAHLPDNVKVIHKTGSITGVVHDAGVVILPDGTSYCLVLLSKKLEDSEKGKATLANISKILYEHTIRVKN
ncbi:serine hydrolase [Gynurincola endophyticus]|uniref:serine hydrolase n=1 Tax=Gynurincola endophyticus TaxID=2479004 RepID=UPI000F8EC8CE|nr:serine hydrolase [Gynurincola endophyticus]